MKKLFVFSVLTVVMFANEALVSPKWLHEHLGQDNLRVVEVSNADSYDLRHIAGAVHTSIGKWRMKQDTYLTIRPIKEIEAEIGKLGITKGTHVVLYASFSTPKEFLKATYVYWALNYVGVHNVSLLDGGLNHWVDKGYAVTQKKSSVTPTDFEATIDASKVADLAYVKSHLGKVPMLDARPSDKYLGITPTNTVARNGHIQGAMSYTWYYSVNSDFTLKSVTALEKLMEEGYRLDKNKEVLVYCTGGLETSFNYFLLSGVLGYHHVRLYDASMKQWGNRQETPMRQYRYEMYQ